MAYSALGPGEEGALTESYVTLALGPAEGGLTESHALQARSCARIAHAELALGGEHNSTRVNKVFDTASP